MLVGRVAMMAGKIAIMAERVLIMARKTVMMADWKSAVTRMVLIETCIALKRFETTAEMGVLTRKISSPLPCSTVKKMWKKL